MNPGLNYITSESYEYALSDELGGSDEGSEEYLDSEEEGSEEYEGSEEEEYSEEEEESKEKKSKKDKHKKDKTKKEKDPSKGSSRSHKKHKKPADDGHRLVKGRHHSHPGDPTRLLEKQVEISQQNSMAIAIFLPKIPDLFHTSLPQLVLCQLSLFFFIRKPADTYKHV